MTFIMATPLTIRDIPKDNLKETRTMTSLKNGQEGYGSFSLERAKSCLVEHRVSNRWMFPKELFL